MAHNIQDEVDFNTRSYPIRSHRNKTFSEDVWEVVDSKKKNKSKSQPKKITKNTQNDEKNKLIPSPNQLFIKEDKKAIDSSEPRGIEILSNGNSNGMKYYFI